MAHVVTSVTSQIMAFTRNGPCLVLMYLLLVCMADICSSQRIDLGKDSCTGPGEIEILRKELVVLSQVVKDQAIRIDIMEEALTSVKQECCQSASLLSSSESSPTSTLTTTKASVISTTTIPTTQRDETTESPVSIGGIETCLVDPQCFVQQNFTYDDSFNSCYGDMYIKNSTYDPGKYVGIILCSPTRYHLFMGDDIDGMFYNIGDGTGIGEDHCELVGGTDSTAIMALDYRNSPNTQGYYRFSMYQRFTFGDIGYLGTSNKWFGSWIECGITIPDDVIVYRREISDLN